MLILENSMFSCECALLKNHHTINTMLNYIFLGNKKSRVFFHVGDIP